MTTHVSLLKRECFVCNKLVKPSIVMDAHIVCYTWQKSFEKDNNMLYFNKYNDYTCVPCGKDLMEWDNFKNKREYLLNRTLEKQNINITLPLPKKIELCVTCNGYTQYLTSDSIYIRFGYIEGLGQFCEDCYSKTIDNRFMMREFHRDYLF